MYTVVDNSEYSKNSISSDIFGLNFVISYDMEFLRSGPLLDLLGTLNPDSLRYPGGSVTEIMFSQVEYSGGNWADQYFSSMQNGLTQRDNMESFVQSASEVGASIQLVIPTAIGYRQSAGQAIASGSYGERRDIDARYFQLVYDYIMEFMEVSKKNGVEISKIEIGNEYWGSGQMTGSEYGYLAASVTEFISNHFPNLDVISQVSYSGGFFSPVEDTSVYLSKNGDDFDVYFPWQDLTDIPELVEHVLPGQGSGVGQTQDIAAQFRDNAAALEALDGIVDHVYFRRGFDGIDDERNFALKAIPQTFLDTSGLEEIDTFITEWSVRNETGNKESDDTNHTGLQYASSTLEAFFEIIEHDVVGANFWPTTFGNESIDRRVLVDTSEQDLTFGGEIFRLLSTNLIGLAPVFDFEVQDEIDVHGFSDTEKLVFYVSERSGAMSSFKIDFTNFSLSERAFVNVTYLSGDDPTGVEINSNPLVTELGGYMSSSSVVELDLDPWSIAMIDVQFITSSGDSLDGTISNDHIAADSGNDFIQGYAGNDRLYGQFGNDTLLGGSGNDSLYGGWGNDSISGGDGNDFVAGTFGSNTLYGGGGDDVIIGSEGDNLIYAGAGADSISLETGANLVFGGDGNDEISTSSSLSNWGDGSAAFNASLFSQTGILQFLSINGFSQHLDIIDGGADHDVLFLSDGKDAFFLDNHISKFHSSVALQQTDGGGARISNIEVIHAGLGNDIIDLTSEIYFLEDENIEIYGDSGNDTIWGSSAGETISGGGGDDRLFGGLGADVLSGGAGSDIFEFSIFDSFDRISDFNPAEGDQIYVYGASEGFDLTASWSGGALDVTVNLGSSLTHFSLDVDVAVEEFSELSSSQLLSASLFFV